MTTFDDREKSFEAKFKHDAELRFKIVARRNKLLGLWAAEQMGVTGEAADAYAKEVIASDFEEPGDDDVLRKVLGDFEQKGVAMTEPRLRKEMERLLDTARREIVTE